MALSFAAGTMTLANWGFSAGDIAVIAGASRAAGNWLMAQVKDRNLLDFMRVDAEDIIRRKGIVDVNESHRRWNRKLVLLQNGKKVTLRHPGGAQEPLLENMDKLTWFMTFVVAALDAAVASQTMREVMSALLLHLFTDSPSGLEYLEHELHQHIQGWMSAACVRGISLRARQLWAVLEHEGKHYAGLTPHDEILEITRFLLWLCGNDTTGTVFKTASSDVFCLAYMLEDIGLCIRCYPEGEEWLEDEVCVVFDRSVVDSHILAGDTPTGRTGMRFPMATIAECVSVWPPPVTSVPALSWQEELRSIFARAAGAVAADEIHLVFRVRRQADRGQLVGHRLTYEVLDSGNTAIRASESVHALARLFLLRHSPAVLAALEGVIESMHDHDRGSLAAADAGARGLNLVNSLTLPSIGKLQAFLLAYYYTILHPLVNTEQLTVQEGFGSWGWCDFTFLHYIFDTKSHCGMPGADPKTWQKPSIADPSTWIPRESVLALAAYLFAGASRDQARSVSSTTVGIVGKNFIATSALITSSLDNDELGRLHMLDIDTSAIPTNLRGLVSTTGERYPHFSPSGPQPREVELSALGKLAAECDFTAHIEPDWEGDTQNCRVAYRHQGRIVWRLNVLDKLEAMHQLLVEEGLSWEHRNMYHSPPRKVVTNGPNTAITLLTLAHFHGGNLPNVLSDGAAAAARSKAFLLPASSCTNAIACIVAMCHRVDLDLCLAAEAGQVQPLREALHFDFEGMFILTGSSSMTRPDLTQNCRVEGFYQKGTRLMALDGSRQSRVLGGWY